MVRVGLKLPHAGYHGNALLDTDAFGLESLHFFRIVGQQPAFIDAEVSKDGAANVVLAGIWEMPEKHIGTHCVMSHVLQVVCK